MLSADGGGWPPYYTVFPRYGCGAACSEGGSEEAFGETDCDACAITNYEPISGFPWDPQQTIEWGMFIEGGFLSALETPLPCYTQSIVYLCDYEKKKSDGYDCPSVSGNFAMVLIPIIGDDYSS